MKRLSPHRARERSHAWLVAQSTLDRAALQIHADPRVLHSWSCAGATARLWRRIESSLWELRHSRTRQKLTAAVRNQKHRP